jgi:hypothetical protein
MAQQRLCPGDGFQHVRGSISILNIGPMNDNPDQQSNRVGDDMALAALDPFPRVIAANPSTFSGFHALTVNHTRRWAGCASHPLTRHGNKIAVDFTQEAAAAPVTEIAPNRRDRRKVIGQGIVDIKDQPRNIIVPIQPGQLFRRKAWFCRDGPALTFFGVNSNVSSKTGRRTTPSMQGASTWKGVLVRTRTPTIPNFPNPTCAVGFITLEMGSCPVDRPIPSARSQNDGGAAGRFRSGKRRGG